MASSRRALLFNLVVQVISSKVLSTKLVWGNKQKYARWRKQDTKTDETRYPRQSSSSYYLAYCPIRQGNYITYSNEMCYCRKELMMNYQYDCRPAGQQIVQRPQTKPSQGSMTSPLKPPPVAPPPPPPPNRPSTPPNVDTRP